MLSQTNQKTQGLTSLLIMSIKDQEIIHLMIQLVAIALLWSLLGALNKFAELRGKNKKIMMEQALLKDQALRKKI